MIISFIRFLIQGIVCLFFVFFFNTDAKSTTAPQEKNLLQPITVEMVSALSSMKQCTLPIYQGPARNGQKRLRGFVLKRMIGQGGFGRVYKGTRIHDGRKVSLLFHRAKCFISLSILIPLSAFDLVYNKIICFVVQVAVKFIKKWATMQYINIVSIFFKHLHVTKLKDCPVYPHMGKDLHLTILNDLSSSRDILHLFH